MNIKGTIFIVIISVFIWGVSIYNGWLNEVVLFGYNMFTGFISENKSQISTDENVTTVKYGEFAYKLLTNITIPDNITAVENSAFKGNKLTSVTLGSNVSLGENAFGFGFENVYNNNDMYAGTYTRNDAKSYQWSIWDGNFRYKKNVNDINISGYNGTGGNIVIPEKINGYPVRIIERRAFYEKKITGVTIPNSVTTIEEMAFFGGWDNYRKVSLGTIASVTFGINVTTIENRVFENNLISKIIFPNSVKSIGYSAFADNPITSISIGANVRLGSKDSNGILGEGTGFNTAYSNNGNRAGIYTRPNVKSTTWTRTPR